MKPSKPEPTEVHAETFNDQPREYYNSSDRDLVFISVHPKKIVQPLNWGRISAPRGSHVVVPHGYYKPLNASDDQPFSGTLLTLFGDCIGKGFKSQEQVAAYLRSGGMNRKIRDADPDKPWAN